MKKFSVHFLVLLAFVFSFNNLSARELKLGIFDSAHLDEYHYQPFIDIARSVDFNVDYVSFPKIADSSTMQDLNIDQYDGIIFVLGIEFFKNYLQFLRTFTLEQKQGNRDVLTIVSDKFLRLIEEFSIKQNKLIGFAFPPGGNPKAFAQILRAAGFRMAQIQHFPGLVEDTFVVEDSTKSPTFQKQLGEFFANTMNFLSIPLEKRSYMYNTTLMPPLSQRYPEGQQLPPQMLGALNQLRLSEQTLPLKQSSSLVNALVQTLPYSIYLYNHIRKNYIFITSSTVLSFAGIAENYFVCPDNADFRKQMLEQVQEMMWELNVILSNENLKGRYQEAIKVINENEKPLVPPVVRAMGMKKENKLFPSTYNVGNNFLRGIGWTELHHFYDKPEMNPAEAKELIENKGFDRLFIEYKKLIVETVRLIENEEFEKLVEEIKRLIVGVEGLTETKELEKLTETKEFKNLIESKELKRLRDLYAESQRDFYIECVLRSGINALWFDFDPQVYYSPIGVNKNKKEEFWQAVSRFTKKLSVRAKELEKTPPKIFVGYQIVNNIRPENFPTSPAKDLYGNIYEDIPQPLDKTFWNEEIKKPLIPFLEKWNEPEISHGIKISGVVLDLEMYNRPKSQTGSFLATMGFGTETFENFPDAQLLGVGSLQENIQNLVMNKRMQAYFDYLEEQATEIGRDLREFFREQIPNCDIGCYAVNMGMDWFYKGFYRGLGTKEKPLQLLTFNSEFDTFKSWLNRNEIYVNHSSVLMLSKIRGPEDFWRVNYILDRNNGVWINKFQRLAEDFNRGVLLEWSPMPWEQRLEFCDYMYKYFIQSYVDVLIKTLRETIYPPEILKPTE